MIVDVLPLVVTRTTVIVVVLALGYASWDRNPWSQAYFDNMLKEIVTAPYNPTMPDGRSYVARMQDNDLKKELQENIASETNFFMLIGESGSGKTTMMQHLLKENYTEGVIFVAVNTAKLVDLDKNVLHDVIKEDVLGQFGECKDHPRRSGYPDFVNFIQHANEVRKKAKGEKAHPLIIYITLDTKEDSISYKTMQNIASAVGGIASDLSSKFNACKTIVDFSKTGISDALKKVRTDFVSFEVGAMTEDEFLKIGKQLVVKVPHQNLAMTEAERKKLQAKKDPQNLVEPYLQYYHNWLGGHTKTLMGLVGPKVVSDIESATADTKNETLRNLKAGINAMYELACKSLGKQTNLEVLKGMAEAGAKGVYHLAANDDAITELSKRDSDSTLIRTVEHTHVRIHRYSHALYLHGVERPNPKNETLKEKIAEVKEKFGMNAKSA